MTKSGLSARKDCGYKVKGVSGCKKFAKRYAHRLARRRADRALRRELNKN